MTAHSTPANNFFERVSDTTVAYDAAHNAWLISSIPLEFGTLDRPDRVRQPLDGRRRARSTTPVTIPPPPTKKVDLDKNWTVCDNTGSPFYGRCYTEFDNFGEGDLEYMSTSTDGGVNWSTPVSPAGNAEGPRRPAASCSPTAP